VRPGVTSVHYVMNVKQRRSLHHCGLHCQAEKLVKLCICNHRRCLCSVIRGWRSSAEGLTYNSSGNSLCLRLPKEILTLRLAATRVHCNFTPTPMSTRDVFNEKPATDELVAAEGGEAGSSAVLPRGAVVHTTRGDIWIKLFPDECPKTVENFTTHARNGYYDGVIVHRVIKGFMIQTGDPLGARCKHSGTRRCR